MGPSVYLYLNFSSKVALTNCWALVWNEFHDQVPRTPCESPVPLQRPYLYVQHLAGDAFILSEQLRRRFSNDYVPFEGGKAPREPSNSIQKFVVISCHTSFWLIEACSIGSLAKFKPQTLESATTRSALWATMLLLCPRLFFPVLYSSFHHPSEGPYPIRVPMLSWPNPINALWSTVG